MATSSPARPRLALPILALIVVSAQVVAGQGAAPAGTPPVGVPDSNLVPNASFQGTTGIAAAQNGVVTGTVPTRWRAFAVDGGNIELELLPLAAGALYAGSPPTTAVRLTVAAFGADQGFDHLNALFQIVGHRRHAGEVWLRTGNTDLTPQQMSVTPPIFEGDPGAFTASATANWTRFEGPDFTEPTDVLSLMAFRLANDGGENSVLIALPTVAGAPVANEVPNPGFTGSDGIIVGNVTGTVPDAWRAFAVGSGELHVDTLPVPADGLYPGSQATRAVRLSATNTDSGPGLDHETQLIPLLPGFPYRAEVYLRSGNADESPQAVAVSLPVFDAEGFTGRQPGSFALSVGPEWSLYAGPMFTEADGTFTDIAFRPAADGGEDSIEIALPRIVGPSADPLFHSGFELPPPNQAEKKCAEFVLSRNCTRFSHLHHDGFCPCLLSVALGRFNSSDAGTSLKSAISLRVFGNEKSLRKPPSKFDKRCL